MTDRDSHIDNAKGLLIYLVLLGHLVFPVPNPDRASETLYIFIYMFHMPMFALVSGYLSHATMDGKRLMGEAGKLLVPYAIFIAIQWAILTVAGQTPYPIHEGHFGLWFLLSLFCWRLLLPVALRLPYPLPVSIVVAMLCGLIPLIDMGFSLSRTLVLMPFFLAGHLLRKKGTMFTDMMGKPVAAVILVAALVTAFFLSGQGVQSLLWGGFSYERLGLPLWLGPILRGAHLAVAFAVGLAFLAFVPKGTITFTQFGRHSLHVYLLHSMLLVFYRSWPEYHEFIGQQVWCMLPVAYVVAWALSSEPVVNGTACLVSPLSKK